MVAPLTHHYCIAILLAAVGQGFAWCDQDDPSTRHITSGTGGLKAPVLESDRVVRQLPGPIRDVAVGGSGRYLIFHLPTLQQLCVFDLNEAKVVGNVPLPEGWVKFAAGMDKLIVSLPEKNIIQRWNLQTLERELSVYSPFKGKVLVLAMGCASNGPAVVYAGEIELGGWPKGQFGLLNIQTMRRMDVRVTSASGGTVDIGRGAHFRISADGRVLGQENLNDSNSFVLVGKELKVFSKQTKADHVVPSSDGSFLMTGTGVYTDEWKPVHLRGGDIGRYIPACQGKFYLAFGPRINPAAPMRPSLPGKPQPPPQRRVHVYLQGEEQPSDPHQYRDARVRQFFRFYVR
jgi:hypothetical protein